MARAKAQGYCGKPGTCRWCGTKFSKVYAWRPSIKTLVKTLPPTRCTHRPSLSHYRRCDSKKFVRDPLPNPDPYRCVECKTEYPGRWVRKKQGEPVVVGDTSRHGTFCSRVCSELFANAAVDHGVVVITEVVADNSPHSKERFRVKRISLSTRGTINVGNKAGPGGRPATLQEGDHTA